MRYAPLVMLALTLLAGCGEEKWQTKDISGLMPPLAFGLTDERGRDVEATRYRGDITLLYFGYTHCPDVCPTTLARLAATLGDLAPEAGQDVRVLFVSVDPARDDPRRLAAYTDAFGPTIVGLTGNREQLDALTRRYRVTYGYGEKGDNGDYPVSHASGIFAFDREGKARLLIRDSDGPEAVRHDLVRLLAEEG
ncbi:SCO family protein [Halomonas organivorans]|uniref:Protein SCO1/2 n=1 Tax=Halomonas organivorans TaxID=257772 RepID=A0A7W5BVP6_9GAMM|nr:SCO family protein [Halomonas organivorans]MBB3140021.1 protein SCO1/2 [Halomonas organivorans]